RRLHTTFSRDWSSDVCSSDLVVVDVDSGLLPLGILVARGRERSERRAVQALEERAAAAIEPLEGALVQVGEEPADLPVQLRQGESGRASCRECVARAGGTV